MKEKAIIDKGMKEEGIKEEGIKDEGISHEGLVEEWRDEGCSIDIGWITHQMFQEFQINEDIYSIFSKEDIFQFGQLNIQKKSVVKNSYFKLSYCFSLY